MSFPFKAVTFDLDGTLYNVNRLSRRIFCRLLLENPGQIGFHRKVLKNFFLLKEELRLQKYRFKNMRKDEVRLLARRLQIDINLIDQSVERVLFQMIYPELERIGPFPYLHEILSGLSSSGIKIGIISDFPSLKKLKALGLAGYPWSVLMSPEEAGVLKPHPEIFLLALEKMKVAPQETLHVGDRFDCDIMGAQAVKMGSLLFTACRNQWNRDIQVDKTNCPVFSKYQYFFDQVMGYYNWPTGS